LNFFFFRYTLLVRWILLILILYSNKVFSEGEIKEVLSSKKIAVTLIKTLKEERGLIISRTTNEAIAFGHVSNRLSSSEVHVTITEVGDNNIILPGDIVYPLDYNFLKKKNVPGFAAITLTGANCKDSPAKYKELAYLGALT